MSNKFKKIIAYSLILVSLLVITIPFVVSCSSESGPVNNETIFNLLFPNIWVFVAVIVATIILITTITWLVWKPFNSKMEERKKYIEKEIEDANVAKEEALKDRQDAQIELVKTQAEANNMITKATIKANAIQDEIKHQASEQANVIIQNAKKSMESERQKMIDEMDEEIMDVAFAAVTEISKQKITKEDNDKLVKEFINKLDKELDNDK